ncbi:hypothetical protein SAMN04488005_0686 [Yoonia tamlensis]|uniref:Uncharacterized protein n=1 Tax=Yoonia tamlensis TaxID=390270 RepID=A0A1I6FXM7_9RHOB|nr:hypothetical protein [Yoonia tamlensis]SFR34650.1 hypothetical protein SAMN04488005_0686 [Yoonia tamlensis]
MSYEERNTVAGLITSLIVLVYFGGRIWGTWADGGFDGPDGLTLWARTVLWMIPACVVVTIVVTILFNIGHAIFTGTANPSFVTDERDAHIGKRAMQLSMVLISAGFLLALGVLAIGASALVVLNLILASFALGAVASEVFKLAAYRFGL